MAYDLELAERVREALSTQPDLTEQKMFGGLAFMVNGHMTVVASGQGGLMVRTDPSRAAELLATTPAEQTIMRDKEMKGWLRLASTDVADDVHLQDWVDEALAFVSTLPPK